MFPSGIQGNASSATKLQTARNIRTNLSSTSAASFNGTANITPGVTGTLGIANGGTGLTANPSMLINLGSTTAANVLVASPRPGVTGTLPIANGGTGATTAANALKNLGVTATAAELNKLAGATITISGNTITGNLNGVASKASTVKVTTVSPTSATIYYPLFTTTDGDSSVVSIDDNLYYYNGSTYGYFNIGNSSTTGGITLHCNNGKYIDITTAAALRANRSI
jgi:hypothetical protein